MKIRINPLYSMMVLLTGLCIYVATLASYGYLGLQDYIKNEFLFAFLIVFACALLYRDQAIPFYGYGVYFSLVLVAFLSELFNGRAHLLNLGLMMLVVPLLVSFPNHCFRFFIGACFVAQSIFFVQFGVEEFFNSYAMTTALCALEALLFLSLLKKQELRVQLVVFFISIAFLLILGSRTSFLAYTLAGFLIILGSIKNVKKNRILVIVAFSVLCILMIWLYYDRLYEFFFSKWIKEGYSDIDHSSGRFKMWKSVFQNHVTWWGHRENFVFDTYKHEDAHNIFVQVVVKYGIIPTAMFVIWFVDLIKRIFKLSGKARLYFATVFFFFFLTGTFENVLFLDCKVFLITFTFIVNLAWLYKVTSKKGLVESAPTMFERQ